MPLPNNDTSSASRRIVVDDTDARIVYDGPWVADMRGGQDSIGNFGKAFQGSLHGVFNASASFSFVFEGSSAKIVGTLNARTQSGSMDPTWECFLDEESLGKFPAADSPQNNWPLCEYKSDTPRTHNLSLYAISSGRHFWLDYIEYTPPPETLMEHAYVMVQANDSAILYGPSWQKETVNDHLGRWTAKKGDPVNITFIGTGFQWFGWAPNDTSQTSSLGSYSVDGEAPIPFILPGIPRGVSTSQYNQKFFETPELRFGAHTISVSYIGSNTPLTLDYLIILNQTTGSNMQTTDILAVAPSATTAGSPISTSSRINTGLIIGIVLGSVSALVLFILAFVFGRRWYRKRNLPTIQPLPGYVHPTEPRAPLDLDVIPRRYSVELEERYHNYPSPFHVRRRSRVFNPEVRSTITSESLDLNPPPVRHAPPSTSNPETGLMATTAGAPAIMPVSPEKKRPAKGADPYSAGYPYANLELSHYEQLVAATKAEEARRKSARAHRNHR